MWRPDAGHACPRRGSDRGAEGDQHRADVVRFDTRRFQGGQAARAAVEHETLGAAVEEKARLEAPAVAERVAEPMKRNRTSVIQL
jgi:hypothetical protein